MADGIFAHFTLRSTSGCANGSRYGTSQTALDTLCGIRKRREAFQCRATILPLVSWLAGSRVMGRALGFRRRSCDSVEIVRDNELVGTGLEARHWDLRLIGWLIEGGSR